MANIKACFKSRWGSDGVIMECDFSQLEVIGAAEISGDVNMHKDILDGIDSHSQSASWLNKQYTYEEIREGYLSGDKMFEKMRKNAKAPRFQLLYGAGAGSIAISNKIEIDEAKAFVDSFYERYSGLKSFQDSVADDVEQGKWTIDKREVKTKDGVRKQVKVFGGEWASCTGRRYYFEESEAPAFLQKRGVFFSFSPTKFKNYPSQGFATGDIVPEMLGRVVRALFKYNLYDKCLPINTIHDSIIFDVHKDNLPTSARVVQKVMQAAPLAMEKRFGLKLSLPFNVDVEVGDSWDEMKGYAV
jgi:DNA polymerase I-like protein with 3'-5' exonuclease and polymerase domains